MDSSSIPPRSGCMTEGSVRGLVGRRRGGRTHTRCRQRRDESPSRGEQRLQGAGRRRRTGCQSRVLEDRAWKLPPLLPRGPEHSTSCPRAAAPCSCPSHGQPDPALRVCRGRALQGVRPLLDAAPAPRDPRCGRLLSPSCPRHPPRVPCRGMSVPAAGGLCSRLLRRNRWDPGVFPGKEEEGRGDQYVSAKGLFVGIRKAGTLLPAPLSIEVTSGNGFLQRASD